jgi:hypothetical protein
MSVFWRFLPLFWGSFLPRPNKEGFLPKKHEKTGVFQKVAHQVPTFVVLK